VAGFAVRRLRRAWTLGNALVVRLFRLVAIPALAVVVAGTPAIAGDAAQSVAEADRNGDGAIDRKEAERRALEVFSFVDNNKDAYLSRDEYNALVLEGAFAAADANRDGKVSTHEFVAVRYREFDALDRNHDGIVTEEESGEGPSRAGAAPPATPPPPDDPPRD
jgi:hypothetical protein